MVASATPHGTSPPRCVCRQASRDALVNENLDFARTLARTLSARLPNYIDVEELESDAFLGLFKAAKSFDPQRGVSFRSYAAKRVLGQMLDGLRERNQIRRDRPTPKLQSLNAEAKFEDGQPMTIGDTIADDAEPVGMRLEMCEEAELILSRLSPQSRKHLTERYLEGQTQTEIARRLGISQAGVAQRMRFIRKWVDQIRRGRG